MVREVFEKKVIFGESVRGASHRHSGTECQDSHGCGHFKGGGGDSYILAVADGHGSDACPYSKDGSSIAAATFVKIMEEYCKSYDGDFDSLLTFLNRDGGTKVAQTIEAEWKKRVLKTHADNMRNSAAAESEIYRQYGSTLVGLMITPGFIFALQIGDGDAVLIDGAGIAPVISSDKILGIETHSLSAPNAWKKAISITERRDAEEREENPYVFMLSTDGFANSFASDGEYKKSCMGYYDMIKEHGPLEVAENLKKWLSETSEMGCGDDISVLFFADIVQPESP